jgi:hypothetical protein
MSSVAPLLVRCMLRGSKALERLQLAFEANHPPTDILRDQLARELLGFGTSTPGELSCPRVSCYSVSTPDPRHVDHAMAVLAVVLPGEHHALVDEPVSRLQNKKLKQKLFKDIGVVVVPRGMLEDASVEIEHSPERCLCFTPAREQHHDLMAPKEPGTAQAKWVQRVLETLLNGLQCQKASWYRVLAPSCLDPGRPPQVDFIEQVEAVCMACEERYGPLDGPDAPLWSDAPQLSAAEQRARLCKLREEVAEVLRRRGLERHAPQRLDAPALRLWPPE